MCVIRCIVDRSKVKIYNHQCSHKLLISWHWKPRSMLCAAPRTWLLLQPVIHWCRNSCSKAFSQAQNLTITRSTEISKCHFWTPNRISKMTKGYPPHTMSPLSQGLHGLIQAILSLKHTPLDSLRSKNVSKSNVIV